MLSKQAIVLIDVPRRDDNGLYVSPVRGDISPLDVLVLRMECLVPRENIVLFTGRGPQFSIFNRFVATRNISMFSTKVEHRLMRILTAVAANRIETIIRVCADHIFADPGPIEKLAEFHIGREKAACSYFENVPAWAGAEALGLDSLQIAYDTVGPGEVGDVEPADFFKNFADDFDCRSFRAPVAGRWPAREYSLATTESTANVIDAIRRLPDPVSVSATDLPA